MGWIMRIKNKAVRQLLNTRDVYGISGIKSSKTLCLNVYALGNRSVYKLFINDLGY